MLALALRNHHFDDEPARGLRERGVQVNEVLLAGLVAFRASLEKLWGRDVCSSVEAWLSGMVLLAGILPLSDTVQGAVVLDMVVILASCSHFLQVAVLVLLLGEVGGLD